MHIPGISWLLAVDYSQGAAMRDSFDHYFLGWSLDPDEPAEVQADFAALVTAVGDFITNDPEAAAEWRAFPLDGKKECFFHFAMNAHAAGALPLPTHTLFSKLKATYPRAFF